jgi:cysteine sulfinate desulfinase/cysteine desulfurase-like protein
MGVAPELAESAVRISLGIGSENTDIQRYLSAFGDVIKRLKQGAKEAA